MTLTSAPPTCSANSTGRVATDWDLASVPCLATRGLRSFRDATGTFRYFCPARGHAANAVRRFGLSAVDCWPDHALGCPCRVGGDPVPA